MMGDKDHANPPPSMANDNHSLRLHVAPSLPSDPLLWDIQDDGVEHWIHELKHDQKIEKVLDSIVRSAISISTSTTSTSSLPSDDTLMSDATTCSTSPTTPSSLPPPPSKRTTDTSGGGGTEVESNQTSLPSSPSQQFPPYVAPPATTHHPHSLPQLLFRPWENVGTHLRAAYEEVQQMTGMLDLAISHRNLSVESVDSAPSPDKSKVFFQNIHALMRKKEALAHASASIQEVHTRMKDFRSHQRRYLGSLKFLARHWKIFARHEPKKCFNASFSVDYFNKPLLQSNVPCCYCGKLFTADTRICGFCQKDTHVRKFSLDFECNEVGHPILRFIPAINFKPYLCFQIDEREISYKSKPEKASTSDGEDGLEDELDQEIVAAGMSSCHALLIGLRSSCFVDELINTIRREIVSKHISGAWMLDENSVGMSMNAIPASRMLVFETVDQHLYRKEKAKYLISLEVAAHQMLQDMKKESLTVQDQKGVSGPFPLSDGQCTKAVLPVLNDICCHHYLRDRIRTEIDILANHLPGLRVHWVVTRNPLLSVCLLRLSQIGFEVKIFLRRCEVEVFGFDPSTKFNTENLTRVIVTQILRHIRK